MNGHPENYADQQPPKKGLSTLVIVLIAIVVVLVLGCVLTSIVAAIAIPNLIQARKHGNEASGIGALRTIGTSQAIFREGDKDGNGKLDYGSLAQLNDAGLIDSVLGSGTKQGYFYRCQPGTADPERTWWATARPAIPGTTGDRVFYTNHTGEIRYEVSSQPGSAVGDMDPKTAEFPADAVRVGR